MAGYKLQAVKKGNNFVTYEHELVRPVASYAPWLSDKQFNPAYEIAKDYTLVDKYRCYELWQLVGESAKLSGALMEVGVWRGGTAALIGKKAELRGITDKFYVCDTFTGVVKTGENDPAYIDGAHSDATKENVEEVLNKLQVKNAKFLIGIFPEETQHLVDDIKFRFCHIDVDVYQSAKDIVEWIWPKMVVGGVVVFDDYGFYGYDGITRYVNEERVRKDKLVIHNLNGHAIFVKIAN